MKTAEEIITNSTSKKEYKTLEEFYPFYLSQHANDINRLLHYIGTSFSIILLLVAIYTKNAMIPFPIVGYAFAWIGHFFFERNKPATFKYPFMSLACDFIMLYNFLLGRINKQFRDYKIENIKLIPVN